MKSILGVCIIGTLLAAAIELVAQTPKTPSACANACLNTYVTAVKACNGNPTCLAAARAAAEACIAHCGF